MSHQQLLIQLVPRSAACCVTHTYTAAAAAACTHRWCLAGHANRQAPACSSANTRARLWQGVHHDTQDKGTEQPRFIVGNAFVSTQVSMYCVHVQAFVREGAQDQPK